MGADHRLYRRCPVVGGIALDWITPQSDEDLAGYAARLAAGAGIADGDAVVGTSLGGMVAWEIARIRRLRLVVQVSSVTGPREMAVWLRRLAAAGTLAPWGLLRPRWLPGLDDDRQLCVEMLHQSDPGFLRWAAGRIAIWPGVMLPASQRTMRIHGDQDVLFPIGRQHGIDLVVPGGDHLMILPRGEAVAAAINAALAA